MAPVILGLEGNGIRTFGIIKNQICHTDRCFRQRLIESLFSRFKAELLNGGIFYGLEDAQCRIFEYIEGYYNTVRKYSSIGYLSPNQFEERYWTDFYTAKVDNKN